MVRVFPTTADAKRVSFLPNFDIESNGPATLPLFSLLIDSLTMYFLRSKVHYSGYAWCSKSSHGNLAKLFSYLYDTANTASSFFILYSSMIS